MNNYGKEHFSLHACTYLSRCSCFLAHGVQKARIQSPTCMHLCIVDYSNFDSPIVEPLPVPNVTSTMSVTWYVNTKDQNLLMSYLSSWVKLCIRIAVTVWACDRYFMS